MTKGLWSICQEIEKYKSKHSTLADEIVKTGNLDDLPKISKYATIVYYPRGF